MSVSRPHHGTVAEGVSHALLLHDVTVRDVWEALTILEPPIARAAARERSAQDLECIVAAAAAFIADRGDTEQALQRSAQVFRRGARRARMLRRELGICLRSVIMLTVLVLLFLIVALTGYLIGVYNGLVRVRAAVKLAWSNIDVLLVQRHDELPKLVEVCKQYMQY